MRQDLQLKCLLGFAKKVFVKIAIKVLVRIYNSIVYQDFQIKCCQDLQKFDEVGEK